MSASALIFIITGSFDILIIYEEEQEEDQIFRNRRPGRS